MTHAFFHAREGCHYRTGKELPDILGELRRTSNAEKDEQILDTLDELAEETKGVHYPKRYGRCAEEPFATHPGSPSVSW